MLSAWVPSAQFDLHREREYWVNVLKQKQVRSMHPLWGYVGTLWASPDCPPPQRVRHLPSTTNARVVVSCPGSFALSTAKHSL